MPPSRDRPARVLGPVEAFAWPDGARAAVSLTYDDAIASQLDNAVPALARYGLHATFFLTGHADALRASPESYRALVSAGHELGAHTMDHPCARSFSWVKPGFALEDYDSTRMEADLRENRQELQALAQPAPFSFAYPCGATWIGAAHASYVPLVKELFIAARGSNSRVCDPYQDSLFEVPSVPGNLSGSELTAWVERALLVGGWVVFTFHGVAGDYLTVNADAHEALLGYLAEHRASIWTERFGAVARYVAAKRGR